MNLGYETETLEFKKSTGEMKEAINSICAILNKHQKGELYFGIKPDGTPIGQSVNEKTLRDISIAIGNHIKPQIFPEIRLIVIDDRECVHVKFEGYNQPYFAYGIAKIRVADEDLTMSPEEIADYVIKRNQTDNRWEQQISDVPIAKAKENLLKEYVDRARSIGRIAIEYTNKENVLNKLFLTKGDQLLNAGVALFCDNSIVELQMAIFAGTERLTFNDIQRYNGSVFELIDIAEQYIRNNIHWNVEFDGSIHRKETPEVPVDSIREALVNSFCHKDLNACQSNEVAIYKNRIEIYNPGSFPEGYVPEDFIVREERPVRRNPLIARILYYSKDAESFGTGLKRISEKCKEAGTKVEFKMLKSGFVVVFYRKNHEAGERDISTGVLVEKKLSNEDIIINYIKKNGSITTAVTMDICRYKARSGAQRILNKLLKKGLIVKEGEGKLTKYISS